MSDWAQGFDVAWNHMRRAGTDWCTPAATMRDAHGLVRSVLDSAPWGQDQYGRQFAAGFVGTLEDLLRSCGEGAKSIDDLEAQVDLAARNYERANHPDPRA
ncbi:hypothetical protein [Nonomuraea sp. NEAU-A123]|uniref:hypothetical protein n=1 Tax=Nonomuraea sp. NEAU-A123 TaxID=2839649 RepID=UPI001BE428B3|nr:hypothetical protein [Nonomuraea sp. NEAU-A123]MBT2232001.1 hypothetical protein [Nonomuraea sp. NEAU-A123]